MNHRKFQAEIFGRAQVLRRVGGVIARREIADADLSGPQKTPLGWRCGEVLGCEPRTSPALWEVCISCKLRICEPGMICRQPFSGVLVPEYGLAVLRRLAEIMRAKQSDVGADEHLRDVQEAHIGNQPQPKSVDAQHDALQIFGPPVGIPGDEPIEMTPGFAHQFVDASSRLSTPLAIKRFRAATLKSELSRKIASTGPRSCGCTKSRRKPSPGSPKKT